VEDRKNKLFIQIKCPRNLRATKLRECNSLLAVTEMPATRGPFRDSTATGAPDITGSRKDPLPAQ
jgi:hypothetical protein